MVFDRRLVEHFDHVVSRKKVPFSIAIRHEGTRSQTLAHVNSKNEIRLKKTGEDGKKRGVSVEISKAGKKERSRNGLPPPNENIIIIYHDFLLTPRRSSHVKSDKTHTVIKIHPLAHILDT